MTHSLVSLTFSNVCFELLSLTLVAGEKIKIGGLIENALKKEKGAKFYIPFAFIVLTRAIGLGVTAADKYLYNSDVSPLVTSIVLIIFLILK